MTERNIPETHVGKDYVVIINNNEAYKIAQKYDEDEINLEIENMNKARDSGIPVPKVLEVTDRGMIMEMAKGNQALDVWPEFDINKKKTFVLSLTNIIKKFPKKSTSILIIGSLTEEKGKLYLAHTGLNLQNIFVNDDGEITDVIGWRDCEYLPEIYIKRLPSFLGEGNNHNSESDTEILASIFYKKMGKLSEVEKLIIELHGVDSLEYWKKMVEKFDAEIEKVTFL